jgi:hypothetical protein
MNKPTRDLAEWDAEIEADFQRAVAATRKIGRSKRRQRLVACPWGFLADVCRLTEGRAALVVAMYIYRRTHVCSSRTVTLPAAELAELGISRWVKADALGRLQAAGLVGIEESLPGRTAKVTLLWKPR